VAVFVDGCFWHSCPEHGELPVANRAFWVEKFRANRERDERTDRLLRANGWVVVRAWDHEPADEAADRVESVVRGASDQTGYVR
jgi:DNA mismatch endonuclease (patch repair protein)